MEITDGNKITQYPGMFALPFDYTIRTNFIPLLFKDSHLTLFSFPPVDIFQKLE
jgi:hypothetical protein